MSRASDQATLNCARAVRSVGSLSRSQAFLQYLRGGFEILEEHAGVREDETGLEILFRLGRDSRGEMLPRPLSELRASSRSPREPRNE